jgi:hypothetical protein
LLLQNIIKIVFPKKKERIQRRMRLEGKGTYQLPHKLLETGFVLIFVRKAMSSFPWQHEGIFVQGED